MTFWLRALQQKLSEGGNTQTLGTFPVADPGLSFSGSALVQFNRADKLAGGVRGDARETEDTGDRISGAMRGAAQNRKKTQGDSGGVVCGPL